MIGFEHLLKLVRVQRKVLIELGRWAGGALYDGQIYIYSCEVNLLICQKKSFK